MTGLVANRYQLLGEVARGGCGAVFEGRDLHLDRLVAIKILQAGGFDRAAAARFAREARVAAAIHHPNVCTVSDSGLLDNGSPFLVMERLYGETLRAYGARVGRIDAEEAIELAVQMLSGLEAAHALGIVHRDMKPENVFVLRPPGGLPLVKLLDFGMCRRRAVEISLDADDRSLTRAGTVVGTPEYMAPEQASGRRSFDQRIDLYAVGVMLYEMLTGTRAFTGPDPRSVLVSVLARQLPSVRTIRPELPVAVDRIVARAVERDPRARYASTGEFQNDLLHARTTLRRQRQARADEEARQRTDGAPSPWDLPTLHHLTRFRRPA
ncbi:MAG TPA: serine/threonine-protein kinase [Labilithrix sp.]|nr:serine/threonine-protein kinase [Labilithrix sp.]